MSKTAIILIGVVVLISIALFFNNFSITGYQVASTTTGSVCSTPENRVGIGTTTPSVNLEVVQNGAIKVGRALLSSGGDYAHLANNEYYTGSAWVGTAPGALIQLAGQQINFFRHDGRGGHTASMSITPGRVDITGSLWVNGRQIA